MSGAGQVARGLERDAEAGRVHHRIRRGAARVLGHGSERALRVEHELLARQAQVQRIVAGGEGDALAIEGDRGGAVVPRLSYRDLQSGIAERADGDDLLLGARLQGERERVWPLRAGTR